MIMYVNDSYVKTDRSPGRLVSKHWFAKLAVQV